MVVSVVCLYVVYSAMQNERVASCFKGKRIFPLKLYSFVMIQQKKSLSENMEILFKFSTRNAFEKIKNRRQSDFP